MPVLKSDAQDLATIQHVLFPSILRSKAVCKALAPSGLSMLQSYCAFTSVVSLTDDQLHVPECFE